MKPAASDSVDTYINAFPPEVRSLLAGIRKLILKTAPEAKENMSYGMPAYKFKGKPLVYFGAFKKHIGFYATPSGHSEFAEELSRYKQGKGSVQFPFDQPMPYNLIERMVKFRAQENQQK